MEYMWYHLQPNMWSNVNIQSEQQLAFEGARAGWDTVTDAEIAAAKAKILALFPEPPQHVKGMPCSNFIYLFTEAEDRHFFVPTSGDEEYALSYEGIASFNFLVPECISFDMVRFSCCGGGEDYECGSESEPEDEDEESLESDPCDVGLGALTL